MTDSASPSPCPFVAEYQPILDFWFPKGEDGSPCTMQTAGKLWYSKNPAFDQKIRETYAGDWMRAAQGQLKHWEGSAYGCLALIVLLDQFPRNMFRNNPGMFGSDERALSVCRSAIASNLDKQLTILERSLLYMPLMHAEEMSAQELGIVKFQELVDLDGSMAGTLKYMNAHADIVRRFGRFPHRNTNLGRESSEEEVEFLKQPGSSF